MDNSRKPPICRDSSSVRVLPRSGNDSSILHSRLIFVRKSRALLGLSSKCMVKLVKLEFAKIATDKLLLLENPIN